MKDFSLILNTGIQIYEPEHEVTIDLNESVMKALRYYVYQFRDTVYMDPVYYFPMKDKFLRRNDLVMCGYLDPNTNVMAPEDVINNHVNWLEDDELLSINGLDVTVGDERLSGLEQIENQWLPLPYYEKDREGSFSYPTNWCRVKLVPVKEKSTAHKKTYRLVMAFDTDENLNFENVSPHFNNGQPFKDYALCGISEKDYRSMSDADKKRINTMTVPLRAYEFVDVKKNPELDGYLRMILHSNPEGRHEDVRERVKFLAYYTYLITYLQQKHIFPDVRLYNDVNQAVIKTNLVLDVGNSRTFGLVAEDPLNLSFSKADPIQLRDLMTGEVYDKPFDMRLCFRREIFGQATVDRQFRWPSYVRLGVEALRNIYDGSRDLESNEEFETNHSSPKRFLWDNKPYEGEWKFVSEKDRYIGPAMKVSIEGLDEQFATDGSFVANPVDFGIKSSYSRRSLMTFCFLEILLQVRMQINSVKFREKNGNESRKRQISRVIITCPTAMPREEQKTLRRCMEEATIVLNRFYNNTFNKAYNPENDNDKVEIIPSVKDLSKNADNYEMRRNWIYDEATCCQMVYLYSEMRRYLGNAKEFFDLYGTRRNGESERSLTVASIDIGAGTTDIMICNYRNSGETIVPTPQFWESFHIAGDELVKRVILDVLINAPQEKYPGASGIITAKLRAIGCQDIPNVKYHFFGDTQSMGVKEKRMRKEFNIQVLIPIANYLLDLLQKDEDDRVVKFDDIFKTTRPSATLLDFFARQMGFRFEDLTIKYSREFLNQIVCKVFEPAMRKWAAIFYSYKCDIVLMAGRPCSLGQLHRLLLRLYSVSPNRLISMNDYRVGSWYPGSSDIGEFGDRKSMVAVGALISYLAETGKLRYLRLNTENLKTKILPTCDYIGLFNPKTGILTPLLTPEIRRAKAEIKGFPIQFGSKQINIGGYPAQLMYVLDFNDEFIRGKAIESLIHQLGLPASAKESDISPDYIVNEMDTLKSRAKRSTLTFAIEREFNTDKELVKIESIQNAERDEITPKMFTLRLQSWEEDENNWLDSGRFIMQIND